jgi:rRNA maturation endonuclease Nob1
MSNRPNPKKNRRARRKRHLKSEELTQADITQSAKAFEAIKDQMLADFFQLEAAAKAAAQKCLDNRSEAETEEDKRVWMSLSQTFGRHCFSMETELDKARALLESYATVFDGDVEIVDVEVMETIDKGEPTNE